MKRLNRGCTAFLLVSVMAATAYADDPPAASAPAPAGSASPTEAPAPAMHAAHKFTGDKTSYYLAGGVGDSTFWTVGVTMPSGISIAAGLNLNYDGNGLAIPGSAMRSTDKFSAEGLVYGSYYFYNKFPIGVAAELALITPLAPSAFDPFVALQPGLVIYYAPFPAPVVIGSGLDLSIVIPKGDAKASVQTLTPGLRIIYVFP